MRPCKEVWSCQGRDEERLLLWITREVPPRYDHLGLQGLRGSIEQVTNQGRTKHSKGTLEHQTKGGRKSIIHYRQEAMYLLWKAWTQSCSLLLQVKRLDRSLYPIWKPQIVRADSDPHCIDPNTSCT